MNVQPQRDGLTIDGPWFRDRHGRARWLRGVNLGGDSKVPFTPDGHSYLPTDFADHRTVSFVGRPAPLEEIDAHLARIAGWGFNCLRLITTWEAVEHGGPGQYDEAYLDYFAQVCRRAGAHDLFVFVDFHQDVWARMSGGDGAPGWTFEAAGLDFTRFDAADAALVMAYRYDHRVGGSQPGYPRMSWGSNYRLPANGIMWTLFFAGATFAPTSSVGGIGIQEYLQSHYLGAMARVAERIASLDHVIGFDTLNEPGSGWVGQGLCDRGATLSGPAFSPLDALAVASGLTRTLPLVELGRGVVGERQVNPDGVSIWLPGREDPFRAAGAWDVGPDGAPMARAPDHFRLLDGRQACMERDFMLPFYHRVASTIRAIRPDWLIFAETDPFAALRGEGGFPAPMPDGTVNASHWYDLGALVTKRFDVMDHRDILTGQALAGRAEIEQAYKAGLARLKAAGDRLNDGAPSLVGECGIPYDMNEAQAYRAWAEGDRSDTPWQPQITALELMYNALDALGLHSTQWNYTVSNRNDPMIGDGWNQEDLSIWSIDQATSSDDPHSGGRAVRGFCRPHAHAVQGTPLLQRFSMADGVYELQFDADRSIAAPTVVYVPELQFPNGYDIDADGVSASPRGQFLDIAALRSGPVSLRLARRAS
jgi:hypothetical protein